MSESQRLGEHGNLIKTSIFLNNLGNICLLKYQKRYSPYLPILAIFVDPQEPKALWPVLLNLLALQVWYLTVIVVGVDNIFSKLNIFH